MVTVWLKKELCLNLLIIHKIMETKNETSHPRVDCEKLRNKILGTGRNLPTKTAKGYITNILKNWGDTSGKSYNFGYLFGLDKVTIFMNQISDYNNNLKPGQLPVEGIRVFVGRKESDATGVPREKIMDTVFLMPVDHNGNDLSGVQPPLDKDDPDIILGDPRPCPNECLKAVSFLRDPEN